MDSSPEHLEGTRLGKTAWYHLMRQATAQITWAVSYSAAFIRLGWHIGSGFAKSTYWYRSPWSIASGTSKCFQVLLFLSWVLCMCISWMPTQLLGSYVCLLWTLASHYTLLMSTPLTIICYIYLPSFFHHSTQGTTNVAYRWSRPSTEWIQTCLHAANWWHLVPSGHPWRHISSCVCKSKRKLRIISKSHSLVCCFGCCLNRFARSWVLWAS